MSKNEKGRRQFSVRNVRCEIGPSINHSSGSNSSRALVVHLGGRKLEWLMEFGQMLDLTPNLSSLKDMHFDPYDKELVDHFLKISKIAYKKLGSNLRENAVFQVASSLVEKILQLARSSCDKQFSYLGSASCPLFQELAMIENVPNVTIASWMVNEKFQVCIHHPLQFGLHGREEPSLASFFAYMDSDPISISRDLIVTAAGAIEKTSFAILFPPQLPCSKGVFGQELPGASSSEDLSNGSIYELIDSLEKRVIQRLLLRQQFCAFLVTQTALIEFDAIDFSFIVLAIRLKKQQLCTICTVEFRLTSQFPDVLPLLSVHDIQTGFSTPIDVSAHRQQCQNSFVAGGIDALATELLKLITDFIKLQAFGS